MGSKIKDITDRLEDISARKAQLGLEKIVEKTTSTWKRRPPLVCLMNHKFMEEMTTKRRLSIGCSTMNHLLLSRSSAWVGYMVQSRGMGEAF